ncbi:MAG: sigma-70 family RNA polymerase sigma factor [Candidatus Latescibacteria bacterium]|nr:sigma-70 family RNA polymerase sigma factor [Candidatus Latescibacterota bacterium]
MDQRALLQAGFRYALSLTHDQAQAEDLVQEAWMRLWQKERQEPAQGPLFTAVRRLFIDHYRRAKLVVFEAYDENQMPADESWAQDLSMEDLEPALAALRPEEREALFLHSVEGYTAREIALFTGRPRGTVLSLIHRSKGKMARLLQRLWGDAAEGH